SIKNDCTRYTWTFNYDPQGSGGNGHIQFTIKSDDKRPQEFEGKTFTVPLPKGYKEQGTTFDRFGLMNSMKPGNPLTIYFDDVTYDGITEDFSKDPGWIGGANHDTYKKSEETGAHHFGYSAESSFAGGKPGEIGGMI